MTSKLRGAAIAAICALALGACSAAETVGGWTEDAASWTKNTVTPASADSTAISYNSIGVASWYGKRSHGRRAPDGTKINMNAMTAAHETLPFGTRVRVTNLSNRRSVIVTINHRGPKKKSHVIKVSRRAAGRLGFRRKGSAKVRVETLGMSKG